MAYLVLALGAILSVWGVFSMYTGYAIVEVERGWAGVIAGATCLAGGMIVMALALVIRSLGNVRNALAALSPPEATAPSAPLPATEGTQHSMDFEARPTGHDTESSAVTDELQSDMFATIMASPAQAPEMLPEPLVLEPAVVAEPAPPRPPLFDLKAPEAPAVKPRQTVTMKPAPLPRREEPPVPPEPERDAVPSMDDWLDRAFSALDNDVAASPGAVEQPGKTWGVPAASKADYALPEPQHHEGHADHATREPEQEAHDQLVQEREEASAPALHDVASGPEPVETPPDTDHDRARDHDHAPAAVQPAILQPGMPAAKPLVLDPAETGRYETDGTTYIMYSDGSIDVQSEAGVYRFASMAELKAYIEGTA